MFSDVAGYTALMGRDESEALRALDAHRELLRRSIPKYNGRMVDEIGDGTLTAFHSAGGARHASAPPPSIPRTLERIRGDSHT